MLPELHTPIPGPKSLALAKELRRFESRNVTFLNDEFPIFWDRADGVNVWDVDGNRFLDLTSAFGVAGLGHGNECIRKALVEQSSKLWHGMGDVHPTALKARLCAKLSALTWQRWTGENAKTVLSNSGFEAIETAMKTALLVTGRAGVLTFKNAYHGVGYGTLSAGGIAKFRDPFKAQLLEFGTQVGYPGPNDLLEPVWEQVESALIKGDVGAVLVEPIQGRGGKVVPPTGFLSGLRDRCDATKTLLILDEIYTGFGRTGALFATDYEGVVPDLICLGKALTAGFPMSACVGSSSLMDTAWPESGGESIHTSTFLGNPLGCAMALTALEELAKPGLLGTVRATGKRFRDLLEQIDHVQRGSVRGRGLMLGVEILDCFGRPDGDTAGRLIVQGLKKGLILLADGPHEHVLAITPPFYIGGSEIQYTCDVIAALLD